jgi:hypothetical protein
MHLFVCLAQKRPLYCVCQKPNDGDKAMVACDNPTCKFQWFHFECIGLDEEEELIGEWFFPLCVSTYKNMK